MEKGKRTGLVRGPPAQQGPAVPGKRRTCHNDQGTPEHGLQEKGSSEKGGKTVNLASMPLTFFSDVSGETPDIKENTATSTDLRRNEQAREGGKGLGRRFGNSAPTMPAAQRRQITKDDRPHMMKRGKEGSMRGKEWYRTRAAKLAPWTSLTWRKRVAKPYVE